MLDFRMGSPDSPNSILKKYTSFRGVDFSAHPSQVDDSRSPSAVNVIADAGGCPQKRPGWRKLTEVASPVRGIYRLETKEISQFIVHAGDKLYRWAGDESAPEMIREGLAGEKSAGFMHGDKLCIMTGEELLYVSESKVGAWSDYGIAYAPITTVWNEKPIKSYNTPPTDKYEHEPENLVTPWRRNSYNISIENVSTSELTHIYYCYLDRPVKQDIPSGALVLRSQRGTVLKGTYYYGYVETLNHTIVEEREGYTTLERWIGVRMHRVLAELRRLGDDSTTFTIEFCEDLSKLDEEKLKLRNRINKCHIIGRYNQRLFVTGNPDYPNADFYSEMGEPLYFSDVNYTEIGEESSPILGYLPVGDEQAVIKEHGIDIHDSAVYLRSSAWDEDFGYYFPIKRGIVGEGAVAPNCTAILADDAMFLSKSGVQAVITDNILGERVLSMRSTRVNKKLLDEDSLTDAKICVWNGFLIIAAGGHAYIADSRQRSYTRNTTGTYEYEWYYWENLPAHCFNVWENALFFGTADGKLCRLNTDLVKTDGRTDMRTYSDWPEGLSGEPVPIVAEWSTKLDDDGDFTIKKNMTRRGCGVFLKGSERGNVKICVRCDRDMNTEKLLAHKKRGVFSFNDMDFENFTFETSCSMVALPKKRVRKYGAIQVICRSDEVNNDFGLLAIERRFVPNGYRK